jgi:hypothetical protein
MATKEALSSSLYEFSKEFFETEEFKETKRERTWDDEIYDYAALQKMKHPFIAIEDRLRSKIMQEFYQWMLKHHSKVVEEYSHNLPMYWKVMKCWNFL